LPERDVARRVAKIRAIEAERDAFDHVEVFGHARIRAAAAHFRAIHRVVHRIAKRLVDVTSGIGVQRNHLADGHCFLLLSANEPVERTRVPLEGC
jgi:hypothetical protein